MLSDGGAHAYYQGIVLTTGTLAYTDGTTWSSAFNASEWQTLWDYQAKYQVRTAIAYAIPTRTWATAPRPRRRGWTPRRIRSRLDSRPRVSRSFPT